MRILRTPYQGFMADNDMFAYYPGWSDSAATLRNEATVLGRLGRDRHLVPINGGGPPTQIGSLFNPERTTLGGWAWADIVATVGTTSADTGYISNASVGFAFAFWHRFSLNGVSYVFMERSSVPNGTGTNFPVLQVVRQSDYRFAVRLAATTASLANYVTTSPTTTGLFAFELDPSAGKVRLYIDGALDSEHNAVPVNTTAGTNASTRWVVGGSIYNVSGGSYNSPGDPIKGVSGEMAFWRRSLGSAKQRALYRGCVQPWDDNVLLASDQYKVCVRVLIADVNDVMQDLTNIDGQDFVVSVERDTTVDDATQTASVTLRRRRGRLADLSPLGTISDTPYLNLLALRRKVIIERAFVPQGWGIQGWEWEPVFEGAIDSWDLGAETVSLKCSDKSFALRDVFVLDGRAYNYDNNNLSAEQVQDQIINDFEPRIPDGGGGAWVTIGYKNYGKPRVYSEAGTVSTPAFLGSALMLRYNDVSSGPVMNALQAVSDQAGFATEFKYHEPWATHRLTMYSPRRTKVIPHQWLSRLGPQEVLFEFRTPHGLSEFSRLAVGGTGVTSLNQSYSVASVMDFYRVTALSVTGATVASGASVGPSSGTVTFLHNYGLDPAMVLDLAPAKSDINRIRNHAIVRFNRNESTATIAVTAVNVSSGILTVELGSDITNLDPLGTGVAFTLAGGTGGNAQLNGSYTGRVTGPRFIQSDVTGSAADGLYIGAGLPVFSCVHLTFREIASTASSSLSEFGYLPVAVYEGSNLAINTEAEARRLADALIADLASPTVTFSFVSRVKPFEIHDVLRMPEDVVRGRWNGERTIAITGVSERYSSGDCLATYEARLNQPSRGTLWTERILVSPIRPAPVVNHPVDIVDQSLRLALEEAATFARQFNLIRRSPQRREMGLRNDQTMVWMSTGSAGFVPNDSNRVGVFRGERIAIDAMGDGSPLTPGVPHYMRFGEVDIFGNVSMITGMGAASVATIPEFIPRFADRTASCLITAESGVTASFTTASGWQRLDLPNENAGGDDAGLSYDDYGLYSVASAFFMAPCDGVFTANHASSWKGDITKVTASVSWYMLVGWLHHRGGVTLGFYGETGLAGVGPTTPYRLTANAVITCSSGDRLTLMWRNASASGLDIVNVAEGTLSDDYMMVSYALGNQR